MYVLTRSVDSKNFKGVAGMRLPPKYDKPSVIRHFREKYGADILKEINRHNIEDFEEIIRRGGEDLKAKVRELSALCAEQEKKIVALEKENESLKARFGKKEHAVQQGAAQ